MLARLKDLIEETGSTVNEPLLTDEIRAFEGRYGLTLPEEYREFLLEVANGGAFGPTYGLLPLGQVPEYWRRAYDYSACLGKAFTFNEEWVWEDDDLEDEAVGLRLDRVRDGVLLLGEEGCGANWTLITSGECRGEVWLMTGEGMTPCRPRLGFCRWLEARIRGGFNWWASMVSHWGPHEDAYFHFHAAKQPTAMSEASDCPNPFLIDQSSPLCEDCVRYLRRFAHHRNVTVVVSDPRHRRLFYPDGQTSVLPPAGDEAIEVETEASYRKRMLRVLQSKLSRRRS